MQTLTFASYMLRSLRQLLPSLLLCGSIVLASLSPSSAWGQKKFEGVVDYKLTYKGEFGQQFAHLLPTRLRFYFKGDSILTDIDGPLKTYCWKTRHIAGQDTIWTWNDSLQSLQYTLRGNYQRLFPFSDSSVRVMPYTETILNYPCKQYRTKLRNRFGKVELRVWASREVKINFKAFAAAAPKGLYFYTMNMPGFPLKVIQYMTSIDLLSQALCVRLKPQTVPTTRFDLPKNYRIDPFASNDDPPPLPPDAGGKRPSLLPK
jgi:hypothetical protein